MRSTHRDRQIQDCRAHKHPVERVSCRAAFVTLHVQGLPDKGAMCTAPASSSHEEAALQAGSPSASVWLCGAHKVVRCAM